MATNLCISDNKTCFNRTVFCFHYWNCKKLEARPLEFNLTSVEIGCNPTLAIDFFNNF